MTTSLIPNRYGVQTPNGNFLFRVIKTEDGSIGFITMPRSSAVGFSKGRAHWLCRKLGNGFSVVKL